MTVRDASRLPVSITKDLSRELGERVARSTYAVAGMADHKMDKFEIAIGGLGISIAICAGIFSAAAGRKFDPFDVGIALLEEIRDARGAHDSTALMVRVATKLGEKS